MVMKQSEYIPVLFVSFMYGRKTTVHNEEMPFLIRQMHAAVNINYIICPFNQVMCCILSMICFSAFPDQPARIQGQRVKRSTTLQ